MWYEIIVITLWFLEKSEHYRLIRNFNNADKNSLINCDFNIKFY